MESEKEKIINSIRQRILDEHRKYAHQEHMDWARLAAGKIYMSYISQTPPEFIPVKEASFDEIFSDTFIKFSELPLKEVDVSGLNMI